MVSVLIVTHNHVNYIEDCIRSVFNQKTKYDINLIIVDDNSDDGTSEKICNIIEESPFQIEYYRMDTNVGIEESFCFGFNKIKAPFAIIMDGDDFFLNSDKIQWQCDLMLANIEYMGVSHGVRELVDPTVVKYAPFKNHEKQVITSEHIGLNRLFHTNTLLFRTDVLTQLIKVKEFFYCHDILLTCLLLEKGAIMYIQRQDAVYRRHLLSNSLSENKDRYFGTLFKMYRYLLMRDGFESFRIIYKQAMHRCLHQWAAWGGRNRKVRFNLDWLLLTIENPLKLSLKDRIYPIWLLLKSLLFMSK